MKLLSVARFWRRARRKAKITSTYLAMSDKKFTHEIAAYILRKAEYTANTERGVKKLRVGYEKKFKRLNRRIVCFFGQTSEQLKMPITACCFNSRGNIFAYSSSYDWSKVRFIAATKKPDS